MELLLVSSFRTKQPVIMKTKEKHIKSKDLLENYAAQINWDWLFFKGQTIFGGILILGLMIFLLWFTR